MIYLVANKDVAQALPEGLAIPIGGLSTVPTSATTIAGHRDAMIVICDSEIRARAVKEIRTACPALMLYNLDPLNVGDTLPRTNEDVAAMIRNNTNLKEKATVIPPSGVEDITTIASPDLRKQKRYTSSLPALDRITGGMRPGEVTEICASAGVGKSTLSKNFLLSVIGHTGDNVYLYSGEMDPAAEKNNIDIMANGGHEGYLDSWEDPLTHLIHYSVTPERSQQIADKLRGRLFLASGPATIDTILAQAEIMVTHFGCGLIVIDNLMCLTIAGTGGASRESDKFALQADIVSRVKQFAIAFGVHVILVLHPRKGSAAGGAQGPSMDSISGSSDIFNLVDSVLFLSRNTPPVDKNGNETPVADTSLYVLKNRSVGKLGKISLEFDIASRTYYESPIGADPASKTAGAMCELLDWNEPSTIKDKAIGRKVYSMPDKRFEQTTLREIAPDWVADDDDGELPF